MYWKSIFVILKSENRLPERKSDNLYNLRSTVQFNFDTLNKSILLQGHFMKRNWGLRSSCHFKAKVSRTSVTAMGVLACCKYLEFENIVSMWDNIFKNGPSKICERKRLKNLKGYGLLKADHISSNFLKAVFHKFYSVHSLILWLISSLFYEPDLQFQTIFHFLFIQTAVCLIDPNGSLS